MAGTIFETPHNLKELKILNRVPLKCSVFSLFPRLQRGSPTDLRTISKGFSVSFLILSLSA